MNLSSIRTSVIALVSVVSLAACDSGAILLWPWVEVSDASDDPDAPPPPPPPLTAVDPLDPDAPTTDGAVPNPNANTGAPADGTPFPDAPENPAVDTGDSKPPVSAETGEELPALPAPTEEASTPTAPPEPPVSEPPVSGSTPEPEAPAPAPAPSFYYFRAGNLAPSSGTGSPEQAPLVPDMAFPIKDAPAIAQTQVYRWGGGVKGGDQCDVRNFTAPWRDNYCETRTTTNATPWCAKTGVHLGQDIRVGTPDGCKAERATKAADRARYEVVAVEDGVISNVGSYSVTLRGDTGGRIYRYLHLNMAKLKVATNQTVKKGDVIGYVSNDFGGTPTTLHLHFEIKLNTAENGWQYAPPYTSLLAAYQRRESNEGERVADDFVVASSPR
jgi:murein DD-endopeptidase MepM/ murein hydrolase activator NlpD